MNVSYEDLLSEIRSLRAEVAALKKENTQLREEVAHLKEQLKLNSKNSSKPPSTDQNGTNDTPKKKGGARPGHPGHFRPLFSANQVDAVVDLPAKNCPTCGGTVQSTGEPPSVHQQVEIAPKPYIVTQYNREHFYCPCCRKYGAAPLPSDIGSSAFGTRLSAFMGFLAGTCRLSRFIERINSVVTTLKRQGKECLDYLVAALSAWKVGSSAPTIFSRPCYTP
jgi:transposase